MFAIAKFVSMIKCKMFLRLNHDVVLLKFHNELPDVEGSLSLKFEMKIF